MTAPLEGAEGAEREELGKEEQLEVIKVLRGFSLSLSREITLDIKFFSSFFLKNPTRVQPTTRRLVLRQSYATPTAPLLSQTQPRRRSWTDS